MIHTYCAILLAFLTSFVCAQPITIPKQYVYPGIPFDANKRLSSDPYITGDTIRACCDWIIDETVTTCDPALIGDGDIVFLNANWCAFFFEKVYPQIKVRYILVTHNSVFHAPSKYEHYLDDPNLVAWFAKNTMIKHPKMHPLPLGMANRYWPHGNISCMDEARNQLATTEKDILLYVNFDTNTNPTRLAIYNHFAEQSFAHVEKAKPFSEYLQDMVRSRFVISPPGASLDCHRIWEALLVDCIPVIMHSPLDMILHDLPVLLIDDWSQVTESFLNQKYQEIQSRAINKEKLFAHYWIEQMYAIKQKIKSDV